MLQGGVTNQATAVLIGGGASSTPGYDDYRCVGVFGGNLYGTDGNFDAALQGFFKFLPASPALPTVSSRTCVCWLPFGHR